MALPVQMEPDRFHLSKSFSSPVSDNGAMAPGPKCLRCRVVRHCLPHHI